LSATNGSHTHDFTPRAASASQGDWYMIGGGGGATTGSGGAHSHTLIMNETGEDPTNKNLPPYYALAFIKQVV
jgi:hypothetical protein